MAMLKYCFEELKLNRVEAQHEVENPASGAVMRHAGMRHEGTLKKTPVQQRRVSGYGAVRDPEGGVSCAGIRSGNGCLTGLLVCALALALSGCGDPAAAYDKALAIFAEGDYAEAATAFSKLGDYLQAETYAAYAQGLTYYEQGSYSAAEPFFRADAGLYVRRGSATASAMPACWRRRSSLPRRRSGLRRSGSLRTRYSAPRTARPRTAVEAGDYEAALIHYQDAAGYADAAARLDALNFEIYERATGFKDAMA